MPHVSETIPEALQPEVDAALAWFNASQNEEFEVTGIVDADAALTMEAPRELRLVLCGGDACLQKTFRVASTENGFDIELTNAAAASSDSTSPTPAEFDPPPGARRGWLDSILPRHKFTVLVFYRGFW